MSNMVIELQADFNIEESMEFSSEIEDSFVIKKIDGIDDYNQLKNLPKINNTTLIGNYNEIDPTVPNWAKQTSKPSYTAEEIGAVSSNNSISNSKIDLMFLKIFGI